MLNTRRFIEKCGNLERVNGLYWISVRTNMPCNVLLAMYVLMEIHQKSAKLGPYQSYRIEWDLDDTVRFCLVKSDQSEEYGQSQLFEDEQSARNTLGQMAISGYTVVYLWKVQASVSEKPLRAVLGGLLMDCDDNDIEMIARVRE